MSVRCRTLHQEGYFNVGPTDRPGRGVVQEALEFASFVLVVALSVPRANLQNEHGQWAGPSFISCWRIATSSFRRATLVLG